MGILSGIISFIIGLAVNLLDTVVSLFLDGLGFSLATFEEHFPAAVNFREVFVGLAIGICVLLLIFQIFKSLGVPFGFEAEEPVKLLFKFALFFGLIMYSQSLSEFILGLLVEPYNIFMNTTLESGRDISVIAIAKQLILDTALVGFTAIVVIICVLVLMWEFLKLLIETLERYIVMCFIVYTMPLALAMGPYKSTSEVFRSWCRMFASQAMLLLLNVWSIRLFISFTGVFMTPDSFALPKFFMGYAFLKFAQKIDTLLRIVGMNTASTGNDMLRSLGSTVGSMVIGLRAAGSMGGGALGGIFGGGGGSGSGGGGGLLGRIGSKFGVNVPGQNTDVGGIKSKAAPSTTTEAASDMAGKTSAMDRMTNPVKSRWASGVLHNASNQFGQEVKPQSSQMRDGKTAQNNGKTGRKGKDNEEPSLPKFNDVLDKETKDGLAGIAHGLPHNEFDPETGQFSGGGFKQYKGQEANVIGANQFQPNQNYQQSTFKNKNGENSVLYGNPDTGEAYVVNFSSVDNGVVTGTIQEFDSAAGSLSSPQEFSAVHNSVASSMPEFSTSNIVGDGEKGSYAVSSEANTSFFAPPQSGAGSIVFKDGTVASPAGPAGSSSVSGASGTPGGATVSGGPSSAAPSGASGSGTIASTPGKPAPFSGPTQTVPPLTKPSSTSPANSSPPSSSASPSGSHAAGSTATKDVPSPFSGGSTRGGGAGRESAQRYRIVSSPFGGHGTVSSTPTSGGTGSRSGGGGRSGTPEPVDDVREDADQVNKTDYQFKFSQNANKSGNVTPFRKTVGNEENLTYHPRSDSDAADD